MHTHKKSNLSKKCMWSKRCWCTINKLETLLMGSGSKRDTGTTGIRESKPSAQIYSLWGQEPSQFKSRTGRGPAAFPPAAPRGAGATDHRGPDCPWRRGLTAPGLGEMLVSSAFVCPRLCFLSHAGYMRQKERDSLATCSELAQKVAPWALSPGDSGIGSGIACLLRVWRPSF